MQTYCSDLLDEESGIHKPFAHTSPQPKQLKTLDAKAIKLLGGERDLLGSFTKFFLSVVLHYNVDGVEVESVEKETLANATLMKSLGRVLWKIGEALIIHNKKHEAKVRFVPDDSAALDKEAVVSHIMKDRFADIEKRYANYLEHAGTFAGDSPRPAPLNKRKPTPAKRPNVSSAISHSELPEAPSLVRLQQNGEIDTTMSPSDVCKILGLHGTGIGQLIGVRSHDVISGSGIASIPTSIKIVAFNPPEVNICVAGVMSESDDRIIMKTITVAIDDLVPLEEEEVRTTAKQGPLEMGYEPHMPRVPPFDYEKTIQTMLKLNLQAHAVSLVAAIGWSVSDMVEVVYVPGNGKEVGQGTMQCRVKKEIECGSLRLYPSGGECLHYTEEIARTRVEKKLMLKSCYMRGLLVQAKAKNTQRTWSEEFIFYSAMSHKLSPLLTVDPDDKVTCARSFPPFWAVMLVGRDNKNMVNMMPYMEVYSLPHATPKNHSAQSMEAKITLHMPFLVNARDLVPGELLALPFDGGHASICCEDFPPIGKTTTHEKPSD